MPRPASVTSLIDEAGTRLVKARISLMQSDIRIGDFLCGFTFGEGERVVTLARDRRRIVYNREFVLSATLDELAAMLRGIAERAM